MFGFLGEQLGRRPWIFVLIWCVAVGLAVTWSIRVGEPPPAEVGSILPDDVMHSRASKLLEEAFPDLASESSGVIVVHRSDGVTPTDLQWLEQVAKQAATVKSTNDSGEPIQSTRSYLTPTSQPWLRQRLVSGDGQAALAVINLSSSFISQATIDFVNELDAAIQVDRPEGLTVEVDGSAGAGRDYFVAMIEAVHNTTWVTVIAVLAILIVVYRSPAGALVPLVSIGASVYVAFVLLKLLAFNGMEVSATERLFTIVLLFGAGVDYALFWMARYRETLQTEADRAVATATTTRRVGPAILASAATTILGLMSMLCADLVPAQAAGRVLPLTLLVSLLASLTLTPALARLMGRVLFWPSGPSATGTFGQRAIWPGLADVLTRQPRRVLVLGLLALGIPALIAPALSWRFDAWSQLPPGSSSRRALDIANAHFSEGSLFPNTLLVRLQGESSFDDSRDLSTALAKVLTKNEAVADVYSLDAPLGERVAGSAFGQFGVLSRLARSFYLADDPFVLRFEILVNQAPLSPEAMATLGTLQTEIETWRESRPAGEGPVIQDVLFSGMTSYGIGVRSISDSDQVRIMIVATIVIGVIVFLLIRDLPLTVFMLLATGLTWGATLTITHLFFTQVMDFAGLDYKVRLITFVVIVAVGQDYNIFLVTRLMQQPRELSDAEAVRRAIVRTGSVISSCGLIMAATLGSLWAGGLSLLQEVGFALATGILIDTFFVRPLLVPSFYLVTGRRKRANGRNGAPPSPESADIAST